MDVNVLTVQFDSSWVLSNQAKGSAHLIDDVLRTVSDYIDGVTVVINKEFHRCNIILAGEKTIDVNGLDALLKSSIALITDDSNMGVEIKPLSTDRLKEELCKLKYKLNDEQSAFFKTQFNIDVNDESEDESGTEPETEEKKTEPDEGAAEQTDDVDDPDRLIGLEPVKQWMQELALVTEQHNGFILKGKFPVKQAYLMSINRGNGLSTVLRLMAQTLKKYELMRFAGKSEIIEWDLKYNDDPDDFLSLRDLISELGMPERFNGIISLSIEEWIDKIYDSRIDDLMSFIWKHREHIVFVFTIPFTEDSVIEKIRNRINDVVNLRVMKFVPPSDSDYFEYFQKLISKYDISVSKDAISVLSDIITDERNDGRFYGYNTISKIADDLLYRIVLDAAKTKSPIPENIDEERFSRLYNKEHKRVKSGLEQLDGMVALSEVKNKVQEIISTLKLQKELFASGKNVAKPCFHMMFTGNPGTGKTVVARIIGQIFKEEGLLPVGNFFEVSRQDFVGRFVGHTAPKTLEVCRRAYGSVLFIDEAYLLADGARNSFGAEALGTLIAEMENNRDKMVVIFAGYENELNDLFETNQGLKDRIPHKINFPNYSRSELKEIFYKQLPDTLEFDDGFEVEANKFFAQLSDEFMRAKDFSNGRFVRNLAERIISKAALRIELSTDDEPVRLLANDFILAVADGDFKEMSRQETRRKIGF